MALLDASGLPSSSSHYLGVDHSTLHLKLFKVEGVSFPFETPYHREIEFSRIYVDKLFVDDSLLLCFGCRLALVLFIASLWMRFIPEWCRELQCEERHIEESKLVKGRLLDKLEFMQWMKRYCDLVKGGHNYNALERREASKGGKDASKKCAPSQPLTKSSTARFKTQTSHNSGRTDVSVTNPPVKASKSSSSGGPVYDEQITELKLLADSLEQERDFYFAKLHDIEILCHCPEIKNLQVVDAIKMILYATDDSVSAVEEAKALISKRPEKPKEVLKSDNNNQKRKKTSSFDEEDAGSISLSPRQRVSEDDSDVHCGGSPLLTY